MVRKQLYRFIVAAAAMPFLISGMSVLFALLCTHHAHGQSITADGSMGTQVLEVNSNYTISGGTIQNSNQFHSFG